MGNDLTETKYDSVRQQFAEREDAKQKFLQENKRFAAMVADGFRNFMGMPEQYEYMKDSITAYRSYLPLYSLEDDGSFKEEPIWRDAICHNSDGGFDFGLGIVLEPSPNTLPKQVVQVKIECARGPGTVEVKIAEETVNCAFEGMKCPDISKVYDLLYRLLNKWLASRWGDPESKRSIGFHLN